MQSIEMLFAMPLLLIIAEPLSSCHFDERSEEKSSPAVMEISRSARNDQTQPWTNRWKVLVISDAMKGSSIRGMMIPQSVRVRKVVLKTGSRAGM